MHQVSVLKDVEKEMALPSGVIVTQFTTGNIFSISKADYPLFLGFPGNRTREFTAPKVNISPKVRGERALVILDTCPQRMP